MKKTERSGAGIMRFLLFILLLACIAVSSLLVIEYRNQLDSGGGTHRPASPVRPWQKNTGGSTGNTPAKETEKDIKETEENLEKRTNSKAAEEEDHSLDESIYYCYNRLNLQDRQTYNAILQGIRDMAETTSVDCTDRDLLDHLHFMVLLDHPELFWTGNTVHYTYYDDHTDIAEEYVHSRSERDVMQQEINEQTETILKQIDQNQDDYEKLKALFEYVVQSVDYVDGAPDNQNIYSSLVNKKTVCAGYTRMFQYFAQKLGIECLYITGDIRDEESHAWNIVNLYGSYYQVDSTFGDVESKPENNASKRPEELKIEYAYLCGTDEQFYRDHIVDTENMWIELPLCISTDLNYYRLNGTYVEKYDNNIWNKLKSDLENNIRYFVLQFADQEAYNQFLSAINDGMYADLVREVSNTGTFRTWSSPNENMLVITGWVE